jgi:inhibitor of Bruton tyrosine kinase
MSGSLFQLFYGSDVAGATALLSKNSPQTGPTTTASAKDSASTKLSKQDINKRDALGRTVLHLAASSGSLEFVKALLANPATDVNLLDIESGW